MFFEVYKQGNLIIRGKDILNTLSIDNELMVAPSTSMVLPIEWLEIIDGREEIKIFLDECRVFWGIVWDITVSKEEETIELDVRHVITEWQYRQISVNHAIGNKELNIVYKGDKVKKSSANDETITASDFTVVRKNISGMSNADWIAKAHAYAWKTSNGDKVTITSVDHSAIGSQNQTYPVKFSTAKGTTVTVSCDVVGSIEMQTRRTKSNKNNNETISAIPFTVDVSRHMTVAKAKQKADPKAWVYRHKDQSVAVTSVTTNFNGNVVGNYTLTASTANGTSITITLKVRDGGNDYDVFDDPSVVDKLEDIYNDTNFAYPGWQVEFRDNSEDRMIDYVYSRQNKLEALTQTMELTYDLWWRVGLWDERLVQIGKFGDKKPYILSTKPSGKTNIRIISEPEIDYDFENVVNVATVYSDKSDGGMSSLTLREVYMDEDAQEDGFPVVILHSNANNERNYTNYVSQFPALAPNNEIEYAVIDEASIALESGTLIEGTYAFNDISPFRIEDSNSYRVTDAKRRKAARTVYEAVIKKLIQARRSYDVTVVTEPIPCDLEVGDRIRFIYDNSIWNLEACSSYWKKVLSYDDWFYITAITYNYDEYGNLTNELTLAKWLKTERETSNT